jgi:hypothetical protein
MARRLQWRRLNNAFMKRTNLLLLCLLSFAARVVVADPPALPPKTAEDAINAADLLKHIKVLASDEFEGRAPG